MVQYLVARKIIIVVFVVVQHHSRNKLCFVCNKATNGVFNTAHEIVRRMKEAKKAEEAGD